MEIVDIALVAGRSEDETAWRKAVARALGVHPDRIGEVRVIKQSIDARKAPVKVRLRLEVAVDGELPEKVSPRFDVKPLAASARQVVIVGSGPAGLFAALRCLELGLKPVVLERGKDASARRFDLAPLLRRGEVIEDSNYCFGEGGAGTFSDGKLYTKATKRGPVRQVYEWLVSHGAPERILVEAHPHIGSNLLPKVVMAIRESVIKAGGEVRFGAKVVGLLRAAGRAVGVRLADGSEVEGEAVILATGHSARDVFGMLESEGLRMEAKPFAVGVRVEHPQPMIDRVQYHLMADQGRPVELPAARYRLATKVGGRGVHSFCMCPGGFIVPTATENDEVVVNGMSLSRRDSPFANSGLVVGVEPEDLAGYVPEFGVLAGVAFQKELEQLAKQAGGGGQVAPGQRITDFLAGRDSADLPATSYFPGVNPARIDELLPPDIVRRLSKGLKVFGRRIHGFNSIGGLMVGFETRTSSPVRVPRDPGSLQHPDLPGLFPAGEGAGYAGGIVSAALDGMRCAEAVGG